MSHEFWIPDQPYQNLPLLPPDVDLETKIILRACVEARSALAELKRASELIPNQSMLINTLPILEAQASTEIENIVTTSDHVFRHLDDERTADPATKEALRYRRGLMRGFRSLETRPLCTATAELVCTEIKASDMRVRKVPGTKLANINSGVVTYTPPEGEQKLRELLANWERFLHETTDLDPLIRLAVAHYQFEAIHPFTDGNGRAGRILNSLFLIECQLLTLPILYLSRYIIGHRDSYYRGLIEVTKSGDWESWILFMIQGIEATARWTLAKIDAIRDLIDSTSTHIQERLGSIYSKDLVDTLFQQPYCRISHLVDAGLGRRQTASRHLKKLCEIGVLSERRLGRDKLFVHSRLLQVLTNNSNHFEPWASE